MSPALFQCPSCKKRQGVNIDYGYPSPDLIEHVERNQAVLGGCIQEIGAPERQCLTCGHQWEIIRRRSSADAP